MNQSWSPVAMASILLLAGCAPREGDSQSRYTVTRYKCGEVMGGIPIDDDIYPYTIICTTHYSEDGETLCFEGGTMVIDGLMTPGCDPQDRQADVYILEIDEEFTSYPFQEFDENGIPVEDGFPLVTYTTVTDGQRFRTRHSGWKISDDMLTSWQYADADFNWTMKVAWIDAGDEDEQSCMYPAAGIDALSIFPTIQVCDASHRECWEGTWQIRDDVLYGGSGTWMSTPCSADEWALINWL